jgi:alpha-glucosidase
MPLFYFQFSFLKSISWEKTIDPAACQTDKNVYNDYSRDPARTPYQWDASKNGGFSTSNKTWLPVASDYRQNNVKNQLTAPKSHLKMFMKLLKLRKTEAVLQDGTYEPKVLNDDVVVYRRDVPDAKAYYVILNFGKSAYTVNLQRVFDRVPTRVSVVVTTTNSNLNEG